MAVDEGRGTVGSRSGVWALDAAQAAVRVVIEESRAVDALGDAHAEALVQAVGVAADVWALHQVVDQVPALKTRVCGYPECFNPPRAAVKAGRPPAYCDTARDARGEDAHTAIRSMRRRQQLRDGVTGPVTEPEAVSSGGERPVSYARENVPVTAARVERSVTDGVAAISRSLQELRQQVALVGDEEAAAAEIEGIRHDAAQEVELATGAKLNAERQMRQHKSAADQAGSELAEAIAAAEEANARADRIETDAAEQAQRDQAAVEAAQSDAARVRQEAERDVAAARADAEALVEQVAAERDRVLAERQAEHERLIAEIREQTRAEVATAAGQVEAAQAAADEAAAEVVRVNQAAARDQAVAESAKAELGRLQARYDRAEERHTQELTDAHRDTDTVREQVAAMQTRLDETAERHSVEVAALRREHRDELAADRQRAREEHQSEVQTLRDALTALRPDVGRK